MKKIFLLLYTNRYSTLENVKRLRSRVQGYVTGDEKVWICASLGSIEKERFNPQHINIKVWTEVWNFEVNRSEVELRPRGNRIIRYDVCVFLL